MHQLCLFCSFFLVFVSVPLSVEVAKPVANPLFQDDPPRSSEVQIFLSVFYLCFFNSNYSQLGIPCFLLLFCWMLLTN